MAFVRQPVIKNEIRDNILKPRLTELWKDSSLTAKDIANKLDFGVPNTVFAKLKPYHVWFYRSYFKLPPRRERESGGSRYKYKPEKLGLMSPEMFLTTLDSKLHKNASDLARRQRSYLILHYWSPLRKSEIYERTINDFDVKENFLKIHLLRKKKVYLKNVTDEPLDIPLAFPKIDEVIEWLVNREWYDPISNPQNRPWKISHQTAWEWVREIFPGYYPHFFRFNNITIDANDAKTSIAELKAKTGLHVITIDNYIRASDRIRQEIDRRRAEELTKKGLTSEIPTLIQKEEIKIPKIAPKVMPVEQPKISSVKEKEQKYIQKIDIKKETVTVEKKTEIKSPREIIEEFRKNQSKWREQIISDKEFLEVVTNAIEELKQVKEFHEDWMPYKVLKLQKENVEKKL